MIVIVTDYPEELMEDPSASADRNNKMHWNSLVVDSDAKPSIQGWANRSKLLADMDAAVVNKVVMQGWYWEHQKTCDWNNNWHAQ